MAPGDASTYQQRVIAQSHVPASVPETVARSFDRLRTVLLQALLCYDLYTVAADQARLVAELALRERFVEFYGGTVLFTDGQGKTQTVMATTFDEVYYGIRGVDGRPKRWKIQLCSGRDGFAFTGAWPVFLNGRGRKGCLSGRATGCATASASGSATGSRTPPTTWRAQTTLSAPSPTSRASSASCGARLRHHRVPDTRSCSPGRTPV